MSNQSPEPPERPDDGALERIFAAEESAIHDDGFTARVSEQVHGGFGARRTVIFGAGMAGFGAAVAGIVEMAPHLPRMTGWWDSIALSLQGGDALGLASPGVVIAVALIAGISCLALAVVAQER